MIQGFRRAAVWVAVVILGMISGGCGIGSDADSAASGGLTCLTVNYRENPIGIEDVPVFGWRMQEGTGRQTAYRILVAESPEQLDQQEYVWDSGRTASGISAAVPYGGAALEAGKQYTWKVCVWDEDENLLESAAAASFEMGLTNDDWGGASWIGMKKTGKYRRARVSIT